MNSCKSSTLKDIDSLTNEIEAKFPFFLTISMVLLQILILLLLLIIGIAETNLDEEHGKLYNLPGYKPEFQSKFYGKTKGSGLAIFLKDNLIYSLCNTQSQCYKSSVYFGVVYRPPSAESIEFEAIIKSLPSENVYISGD